MIAAEAYRIRSTWQGLGGVGQWGRELGYRSQPGSDFRPKLLYPPDSDCTCLYSHGKYSWGESVWVSLYY